MRKLSYDSIFNGLKEIGFNEIYSPRLVNSIYYDTPELSCFLESENGDSKRIKLRIRFYDKDTANAFIEYKHKHSDSGWKSKLDLKEFQPFARLEIPGLQSFLVPERIHSNFYPKLLVSYQRDYLLSPCKQFRITLDKQITFGKPYKTLSGLSIINPLKSDVDVVELKYSPNSSIANKKLNQFSKLLDHNGLTLSKFSKYCAGVRLYYC